jgi:hypothetical protein
MTLLDGNGARQRLPAAIQSFRTDLLMHVRAPITASESGPQHVTLGLPLSPLGCTLIRSDVPLGHFRPISPQRLARNPVQAAGPYISQRLHCAGRNALPRHPVVNNNINTSKRIVSSSPQINLERPK